MKLEVYRNLHQATFSIKCVQSKLVVGYAHALCLQHVSFVVSEAGRQQVLRERQKCVHATVRGVLAPVWLTDVSQLRQATYDPYKAPYFLDVETKEPVHSALMVLFRFPKVYYLPK